MRRSRIPHLISVVTLIAAMSASAAGDSLVVTGTGSPGTWTTQLQLANPTGTDLRVTIFQAAGFQECLFPACPFVTVTVPADGTTTLMTSSLSFDSATQLQTIYITPSDGVTFPTVRAEALNQAQVAQKNIIPAVRLSTISALAATMLSFPAASRSATAHSNIAVGAITPDGTNSRFTIRVEVFSPTGALLASGVFDNTVVSELNYGANIVLSDVLGSLGVAELTDGLIRVTKIAGDGALWGEMATVTNECGVLMTEGINP